MKTEKKKTTKKKAITKRKAGPISKKRKEKVMASLTRIIEEGRFKGVTFLELEQDYGLTRKTISGYVDEIYKNLPVEDLNTIYLDIKLIYDRIKKRLLYLWDKLEEDDFFTTTELKIIREIRDTMKDFTEVLERYHIKPKAVEYHAIKEEKVDKIVVEVVNSGTKNRK